jgi:hypothetical protein
MQLKQSVAISEEQPECSFTAGGTCGRKGKCASLTPCQEANIRLCFLLKRRLTFTSKLSRSGNLFSGQSCTSCPAGVLFLSGDVSSFWSSPATPFWFLFSLVSGLFWTGLAACVLSSFFRLSFCFFVFLIVSAQADSLYLNFVFCFPNARAVHLPFL